METPISTTRTADLYLTNCCLRAEIPMLGFTRMSDVFNNVPGLFLHGALLSIDAIKDEARERNFVVRLNDVLFACPLVDDASSSRSPISVERHDRLQQPIVLLLNGWRIRGRLHLVDHIRWVDFATAANTRFIAVTDATVTPPGVQEPIECPFLLANGARLSALYEQAA